MDDYMIVLKCDQLTGFTNDSYFPSALVTGELAPSAGKYNK